MISHIVCLLRGGDQVFFRNSGPVRRDNVRTDLPGQVMSLRESQEINLRAPTCCFCLGSGTPLERFPSKIGFGRTDVRPILLGVCPLRGHFHFLYSLPRPGPWKMFQGLGLGTWSKNRPWNMVQGLALDRPWNMFQGPGLGTSANT